MAYGNMPAKPNRGADWETWGGLAHDNLLQLVTDVPPMKTDVTNLLGRVGTLETTVSGHATQISQHTSAISTLQTQVGTGGGSGSPEIALDTDGVPYVIELANNYSPFLSRVSPDAVLVQDVNGTYTKPASGTPVYLLTGATTTALPSDWVWALSPAEWLTTTALGTVSTDLGIDVSELDVSGDATSGLTPTRSGGITNYTVPSGKTYARSELVMYSGDYSSFRPVEGDRLRIGFDVRLTGVKAISAQGASAGWFCPHQVLGRAISGYFPHAPVSVMVEGDAWKLKGQPGSVFLYGTTTYPYDADGRWYRYEEDILLGRTATGTISAWIDSRAMCTDYKPMLDATTQGYGTFYAGTGDNNRDLSWVYMKTGMYMGATAATTTPIVAETRHRRLTWTSAGSTTTWREPSPVAAGTMRLHRRNTASGIASPILDN